MPFFHEAKRTNEQQQWQEKTKNHFSRKRQTNMEIIQRQLILEADTSMSMGMGVSVSAWGLSVIQNSLSIGAHTCTHSPLESFSFTALFVLPSLLPTLSFSVSHPNSRTVYRLNRDFSYSSLSVWIYYANERKKTTEEQPDSRKKLAFFYMPKSKLCECVSERG